MIDVLGPVGAAIDIAKKLMDIAETSRNAPLKLALADLQIQLAETKIRVAELLDENRALKAARQPPPEMEFRDGSYWRADGSGPFCSGCFDQAKKIIRLQEEADVFSSFGRWVCPACRTHVK